MEEPASKDDQPQKSPLANAADAYLTARFVMGIIACFTLAAAFPFFNLGWPWYRYAMTSAAAVLAGLALIYLWLRTRKAG